MQLGEHGGTAHLNADGLSERCGDTDAAGAVTALEVELSQVLRHQWTRPAGIDRLTFAERGAQRRVPLDCLLACTAEQAAVTPFCIDAATKSLVLVEVDSLRAVHDAPFEDRAVPLHATSRAYLLHFEDAVRWQMNRSPMQHISTPLYIWSTGRCGSTLLHRLLCSAGVACISEPCWFDDLCKMAMAGVSPGADVVRALHSIHWASLGRLYPHARAFGLKPKSYGHHLLPTVAHAFPEARHLFLYRGGVQVSASAPHGISLVSAPAHRSQRSPRYPWQGPVSGALGGLGSAACCESRRRTGQMLSVVRD